MVGLAEGSAAAGAALAAAAVADPLALGDPAGDGERVAQPARARPDTATAAAMTHRDRVIMFGSLLHDRSRTRATGSAPALVVTSYDDADDRSVGGRWL
jgi:hypothetical protein